MMNDRFQRKTVKISVVDHILDAIINRELQPGERILEGEMARSLGVAKTTLREALQYLEHQGVLTKSENRGTYITVLSPQDVRDIYDVRIMLEPEAAVLAHRRLTSRDSDEFERILESMRVAGKRKDYISASKSDMAFHQQIWKISGNAALEKALNAVSVSMFTFSGLYLLNIFLHNASAYERICRDHGELLDALKTGPAGKVKKTFTEKLKVFQSENLIGAEALETTQNQKKTLRRVTVRGEDPHDSETRWDL